MVVVPPVRVVRRPRDTDLLERDEGDFLVLERIRGRTLRELLGEGIEPALQLRIAEQIAEALTAAHTKGIVHRDLKLPNVMLTEEGAVGTAIPSPGFQSGVAGREPLTPLLLLA